MLALPRSRASSTPPEKRFEGVEIGESLPARLIEKPDQNPRRGQGISVSPVAILDIDPEVPRNRVEIPTPQPRDEPARHLDRAMRSTSGISPMASASCRLTKLQSKRILCATKMRAIESLQNIGCDVVEEGRGRDHTIADTRQYFDVGGDRPTGIHQ